MKKVYVPCPGNSVTGGPELIHQFVDAINNKGGEAIVLYFPFEDDFLTPKAYSHYNVKVAKYSDISFNNAVVVINETSTSYIKYFKGAKVFIWWMSVDNYFNSFPDSALSWCKKIVKKLLRHKSLPVKISAMGNYGHLVQSFYAKKFLKQFGYESDFLSDYLNENHFNQEIDLLNKKDIICYNPKKGYEVTEKLRNAYPNFIFKAIINMTPREVSGLLSESKIYIDFGNHPGKDRIPREAAMARCVVITGVKGSAKNKYDIEVPDKYKIDENSEIFVDVVGDLISDTFENYDANLSNFAPYIEKIKNEKKVFQEQVSQFLTNEAQTL
jgi:hypothetical protein